MKFWDGWEAWEKMVFILGCAIVIVIVIAFGVLSYSRWRLRKYARAQSYQVAERARGVDLNEMLIDDVPFGARALESGVRVEGIWTPNHNTPSPNVSPYLSCTPVGSRPPSPPLRLPRPEQRPLAYPSLPQVNSYSPKRSSDVSLINNNTMLP
ncbi:hypothetical protein VTN96DRAFT_7380 [Rasamsonia emersonii]